MKILITGAAGDIGMRLVNRFANTNGIELFTTDIRDLSDNSLATHSKFDVRDQALLDWVEVIEPDVVIHLAAIVNLPEGMSDKDAYDIDVTATKKLLDCCLKIGTKKFVVTSSGAAYGYWSDNPEWISENDPIRGNDDYFYSKHKRHVESLLAKYAKEHPELKQVILRPGTVLGPNFDNPITSIFEKPVITGIAGAASPFVIIWIDDLVEYLIESTTSDIEGAFNVAGDGTLTLSQIAKRLKKPYLAIPAWLIKGALALLKPLGLSQYGPEQVKFLQYRPVLSNKKIKSTFSHQPTSTTQQAFERFLAESNKDYAK